MIRYVKICPDNPIHYGLDRVIDWVAQIDDPYNPDHAFYNASKLVEYIERLHKLASELATLEGEKYQAKLK